jgi:hypothetical protein
MAGKKERAKICLGVYLPEAPSLGSVSDAQLSRLWPESGSVLRGGEPGCGCEWGNSECDFEFGRRCECEDPRRP